MMRLRKFLCAALIALFSIQVLHVTARADEGMWPFNNVPRAEIKRKYGFDITDAWLKKVQMAAVRFNNGGSGSFVSQDGLVLTNYHIVEDFVHELSTTAKDYAKEGFVAHSRAEEMKIPSLELNELISIEDVTDRVNASVKADTSASDAFAMRRASISDIEADSLKQTGLRSDVVTLYQGGRYNLYRYKKYTDVRLVFAPEFQAAFFGGDPDNFNFPRFNIDMALVRVYENGQPVKPENYLKWSTKGVKDGEPVFVAGHPGSTSRLNTVAHLEELREVSIPLIIRYLERREAVLKKYMAMGDEQTTEAQNELNSVQNSLKVYRGQLAGLQDKTLIERKRKSEEALRKAIAADPKRQKEYGDAWDAIATAHKSLASFAKERRFLDLSAAFNTQLFGIARSLVRLAEESEKPNGQRLPEYTDAKRASLELALYSTAPIRLDLEKMKLADSLAFMVEAFGAENPLVKRVLDGKTPDARAAELIDGTKLNDAGFRRQLAAGGRQAIESSIDPMIVLARSIDKDARELRKRYEGEVTGVERTSYSKIARALFETEGDELYPDATFTLRLSYGAVKGYMENGHRVEPFTTLGGLYDRATKFNQKFPYNLPPRWMEKKSALNLKTPFNFVSSNDIIGGNSGSPTINKDAELVGLIFDGNIQSLVGNFYYDESVNRAISVDSRGMLEVLRKVFGANEIADELTKGSMTARR
ncbi:MAG TPA: S46 family peptidase [Pyrinomonadaceae bacterium]|nr:S46 family peptidase [Pyrinomonadaceae bacterium]